VIKMANIQILQGKRGKTYRVQYMRDSNRVTKTFKTRRSAEEFDATLKLHVEVMVGMTNHILNSHSLNDAIEAYLAQHTGKDTSVGHRLRWWSKQLGDKLIGKIYKSDIKSALKILLEEGKANTTYNRFKSAISAVFEFYKDEHDLDHNPARQVKQLKEGRGIERFATEDELSKLLASCKESVWERLYLLVLMAVSTGARRSELINLKWSDVNIKTQTAILHDTKNGESRVLTLTDDLIGELSNYREVGSGWLFPRRMDFTKSFYNFDKYWYQALKLAGITNFRFHDLRHTTGSWLAMQGLPTTVIRDILGHKTIVTTQRYVHHSTQHKAQALNSVFGGITNG
jgi:integrase